MPVIVMTDLSAPPPLPNRAARPPRHFVTLRVIVALMLREMSTTYGRSFMGYLWAILEPVAGIALMSFLFAFGFRSPSIGTNFALFFASGILPFSAYMDLHGKVSVAVRFSKPLLFYPGVTFVDALIARVLLNVITQILISTILFAGIIQAFDLNVILNLPSIALGYAMAFSLAISIGTLNCYLLSVYPLWERSWAILNRPLFLISCIFFTFDTVPQPYQDWLWWNPLVHVVGQTRAGIYATYDASYVSPLFVFTVSGAVLALGLMLLRRYHRDIINM
ncbi:ABC transporter permease [Puniceibacterium sp. IMCC21224]|uniref:ABC transporter permease n=1 Tax=Puniceibacterium sp. IMCC21224 TaxID=1618204 RepID=UPI00065CE797|nr:ABC transporter permease [Puniceibacterium sp. IMCC21224]KMK63984.1 ABC-type polysaccharide/polyol phosphate export system, permease component [Puniceibacterium sp. IMCC21224]